MNTRLQVEHPVTELVTGFDLVREQVNVAAGESCLSRKTMCAGTGTQSSAGFMPKIRRTIFCRRRENFFPAVPAGPGIRDDSGVTEGDEVSIYYDPMISKLAAWGRTRTEAIDRMRRALDEYASAESRPRCLSFARSFATKSSLPDIWTPDLFRVSTSAAVSPQAILRLPACIRIWP
jgi:acetyl/propionyl-CoA carboxylase alpha subunit